MIEDRPGLRVLLLDRQRPTAERALNGWLGEENVPRVMAKCVERYVLIATAETGGEPKYLHLAEFLSSLEGLIARLLFHVELLAQSPWLTQPCGIDMRFLLEPSEHQRVDQVLDEHEAAQLRRACVQGNA
jgi:hypothetical protein